MQRDSIGPAHKETEMETLGTDGRLCMGSFDMDQRMKDNAQDPTKMSNDICGHENGLLYESETASKWNDKTQRNYDEVDGCGDASA